MNLNFPIAVSERVSGSSGLVRGSVFGVACNLLHRREVSTLQSVPRLSLVLLLVDPIMQISEDLTNM